MPSHPAAEKMRHSTTPLHVPHMSSGRAASALAHHLGRQQVFPGAAPKQTGVGRGRYVLAEGHINVCIVQLHPLISPKA